MSLSLNPSLTVYQSRLAQANSGIFHLSIGDVLVDPGLFPGELDTIAAAAPRPPFMVLTHSHWDHILGPRRFPGAAVIAHSLFSITLEGMRDFVMKMLARSKPLMPGERFHLPAPDVMVSQEMELGHAGDELRLIHTPGHTPDHLAVFHAASGTLWAGDMLSDFELPILAHSFNAYEKSIARLAALDVRALVPGHGLPTADGAEARARIEREQAYLAGLREGVSEALGRGLPLPVVLAACAGLNAAYPGTDEDHRANVEAAYLELGGESGEVIGWARMMRQMESESG